MSTKSVGPGEAVQIEFVEVHARPGEPVERMIKRFTRKVREDGVLQEVYERRFYVKPSVERRRKKSNASFMKSSPRVEK